MREIKFRGKVKKSWNYEQGEWVYGGISFYKDGFTYICPERFSDYNEEIEVIPESVGQFTGLYDKNGKEIYEGDILYQDFWGELDDKTPIICKYCNGSICFTKQDFWDYGNNCERGFGWNVRFDKKRIKKCEIVGNIYDNPELIKE